MNEPDAALLERADDAMAESRRLCAQNRACVAESRWWLEQKHRLIQQLQPVLASAGLGR